MYQRIQSSRLARMVLVLVALQIGLAALYGRSLVESQPDHPPTPSLTTRAVGQPSSLESLLAVAQAHANSWRPDAQLMTASLQVDWPLATAPEGAAEIPTGGWASFAFYSDSPDGAVLGLLMERTSGLIFQQDVVPWAGERMRPTILRLDGMPTDSLTALVSAELSAGQPYRTACPDRRHATHVSLAWREGPVRPAVDSTPGVSDALPTPRAGGSAATAARPILVWVVSYEDSAEPGRYPLRVILDARSGNVIEVRGGDQAC